MEPLPEITNLLPPNYMRIFIIGIFVWKILDEAVRRIPDRCIAGHTFIEALVLNVKRLSPLLERLLQRSPQSPPGGDTKPPASGGGAAALLLLALLVAPRSALADPPAAEVRPLPPAPAAVVASEPAAAATPAASVPNLAALPDCISQGAANAALACVTGKAPPPTDRRTFWITWGTSMGSTVATAALAWITNHYALNPDPVK